MSKFFSLANVVDNYYITANTAVDCTFYTYFLDKVLKLRQFDNYLHRLDPVYETNILSFKECNELFDTKKKTQLTNVVEDNSKCISSYQ